MVLLISLLVGIQVVSAWAGYPSSNPELLQPPILSLACNSSMAEAAADLTLQKINTDRREGYVFSLQRIFGVSEIPLINNISNFFLTLDVLETECHVWSRKPYQNCSIRPQHETVYGQCKASVLIDWRRKISHLYNYECVLRPIAPADIARVCPDCPVPGDPTAVRFLKAATKSLAKFNAENNHLHYFRVLNVTKGRSQWVFGPQTVMEYTIRETSCSKRAPVPDVSKCPFLPLEIAAVGVCRGTVAFNQTENHEFVSVYCELYPPQPPAEEENKPKPGKAKRHVDDESHEDGHQHHRNRKRHHHHKPHHHKPHHRHHGTHSHEQQGEQTPSDTFQCPPEKTVGRVTVLPPSSSHVSLHSLPPVPRPPNPSFPDTPSAPEKGHPQPDQANVTVCARKGALPFPDGFSQSDTCPGDPIIQIPGLQLPQKPVGVRDPRDP